MMTRRESARYGRLGTFMAVGVSLIGLFATTIVTLPAGTAAAAGSWSVTGSVDVPRGTATLLPNGKVLMTGSDVATAALYDPATGTWQATGAMTTMRSGHTATLLPNGKVLVAGGARVVDPVTGQVIPGPGSSELYDPATGAWQLSGMMTKGRSGHNATLLPNGKVLVGGGTESVYNEVSTSELYNPATGTWQATGLMVAKRSASTATLLGDGRVLVAGGLVVYASARNDAEIYDPATGHWTATGSMATGHMGGTASLLSNGQVLIAGGGYGSTLTGCCFGENAADLYDPVSGTWHAAARMHFARHSASAMALADGTAMVLGGYVGDGSPLMSSTEIYQPTTDTWTAGPSMNQPRHSSLTVALQNGTYLVASHSTSGVPQTTAEIYSPSQPVAYPEVTLSRTVVNLAGDIDHTFPVQDIGVTNTGGAPLVVSGVSTTSPDFIADAGDCATVAPAAGCTVHVQFTPHQAGTSRATLLIQDNAPGSPHEVALEGLAVAGPHPLITAISPSTGPAAGGTTVTITGTELSGGRVAFGSTQSGLICTETSCTLPSPPGTGTVSVTVLIGNVFSVYGRVSNTVSFTYDPVPPPGPPPVINGITPTSGPTTGGTTVTIAGSNLASGSVKFGTQSATASCTDTVCTATSPSGTGTVHVTVTTAAGPSATATADQFTYQVPPPPAAPIVTGISPTSGTTAGGTAVTVAGSNLASGTVKFGSKTAMAVCTAGSCTTTSPAGSGTVDVKVTTSSGTSAAVSADRFTYQTPPPPPAPVVTGVSPNTGTTAGGTVVTVTGGNLASGTVKFGSKSATAVSCAAGSCTATSPSGTGTVDVKVTTSAGTSATATADKFTYQAAPPPPPPPPPPPGSNLVPNPGFETAGVPADSWGGTLARSSTVVHGGGFALAQTTSSASGGWDLDANSSWYAPVTSTKTYTASVWVRATKATKVVLYVDLLNSTGRYVTSADGNSVTLVADTWTQLSVTVRPASGQVFAAFEPNFSNATSGTIITWDDMSITAN